MSWESVVILRDGEKIVHYWEGDYETSTTVIETRGTYARRHRPREVKQRKEGVLVLTNQRLVWVEKRGVFGKSFHAIFEISLENLKGISMGGAIMKYVFITDVGGENVFHLSGINEQTLEPFKTLIFEQVTARKRFLEEEKKKERVHILLDFSFIKSYMEKGGLSLQTFKCPSCNAPMKLPETGNQVTCTYCSSTVYAQDIFEKVKALIG